MIDQDLIGVPHESGAYDLASGFLDCVGIVLAWYERRGFTAAAQGVRDALELRELSKEWKCIGAMGHAKIGDLVMSTPPKKGGGTELHISVVVSAAPLQVLSSARSVGSFLCSGYSVSNVTGIYRPPTLRAS